MTENVKLSVLAPYNGGKDKKMDTSAPVPPPTTGNQWINIITQLLFRESDELHDRAISMCEEAAAVLVDEETQGITAAPSAIIDHVDNEGMYSPVEDDDGERQAAHAEGFVSLHPTKKLQAAHVLVAGALAALDRGTAAHVQTAVHLAETAVATFKCPMSSITLAQALYQMGMLVCGPDEKEDYSSAAAAVAVEAADQIQRCSDNAGTLTTDDVGYLARAAWILCLLGRSVQVHTYVTTVLKHDERHYLGCLLLALLHSADGDYEAAIAVTMHVEVTHSNDVAAALLGMALRQVASEGSGMNSDAQSRHGASFHHSSDTMLEELAVVLARVQAAASAAKMMGNTEDIGRRKTLKSLCMRYAPGEAEGGQQQQQQQMESSSGSAAVDYFFATSQAQRRAAEQWALLAYVASRAGCFTIAEVAVDAGLDFVSECKSFPAHAFSRLLCTRARLSLMKLAESMPVRTPVTELNLLGITSGSPGAAAAALPAMTSRTPFFSLGASFVAGTTSGTGMWTDASAEEAIAANEVTVACAKALNTIFTCILKAIEVMPYNGEAYCLTGVLRLLEASQPSVSKSERVAKLNAAADSFTKAVRHSPQLPQSYAGLGAVRAAQGASDVSVDFFASASELEASAPLLPFDHFVPLFL